MATYVINNTAGTLSFSIKPGSYSGFGSSQKNTNLQLHGMGSLRWGKDVDSNFYKLLEHFACPRKETGDVAIPGGNPGSYDRSTDRIWPKGPDDQPILTSPVMFDSRVPNSGVSDPIDGQTWYNTEDKIMYYYDATGSNGNGIWKKLAAVHVGPEPPENPALGDLWYHTDAGICDVLDYSNFSGAQLMVYDPTHPENVDGWVSVAQNYVKRCGTTTVCGVWEFVQYPDCNLLNGDDPTADSGARIRNPKLVDAVVVDVESPPTPYTAVNKGDVYKYAFPAGTRMAFCQLNPPTGWTMVTDDGTAGTGAMMRVVQNQGQADLGGTWGGSDSPILNDKAPSHTHVVTIDKDSGDVSEGRHYHIGGSKLAGSHNHKNENSNDDLRRWYSGYTANLHPDDDTSSGSDRWSWNNGQHKHVPSESTTPKEKQTASATHSHSNVSTSEDGSHTHDLNTSGSRKALLSVHYGAGVGGDHSSAYAMHACGTWHNAACVEMKVKTDNSSHDHSFSIKDTGTHKHSLEPIPMNGSWHKHRLEVYPSVEHVHVILIDDPNAEDPTGQDRPVTEGAHTHVGTAGENQGGGSGDWNPKYYNFIIAEKDDPFS